MRDMFVFLLLVLRPAWGQLPASTLLNFTHYDNPLSWHEAQSFCRDKHTDLITIRDEEEDRTVSSVQGWMGLYRTDNAGQWKWSRGDEEATFFNWDDDEPDPNQHCAYRSWSTKWKNRECDHTYSFTCSDEKLVLVKENKTWEEAVEHCRSLGVLDSENPDSGFRMHSYDLATLITEDDRNYAQGLAQQANTDEVWTGLRYLGDEWFWVGGEQVQYQNIVSCPAVRCGVLEKSSSRLFGTEDCSLNRNFFCSKKA